MRWWIVFVLLAGCAAPTDVDETRDEEPEQSTPEALPGLLELTRCDHAEAFWSVPEADVEGLVPEPLDPVIEDGLAGLFFTALRCDTTKIVWIGVHIHAPEGYEPPDRFNGYLVGSFHDGASWPAFSGWPMANVENETITYEEVAMDGHGATLVDAGPLSIRTESPVPAGRVDVLHARFWMADGNVTGALDLKA